MLTQLWSDLRYRLRALLRRAELERDLAAELEFHLAREAQEHERRGVPPAEARRLAHLALGGLERVWEVWSE